MAKKKPYEIVRDKIDKSKEVANLSSDKIAKEYDDSPKQPLINTDIMGEFFPEYRKYKTWTNSPNLEGPDLSVWEYAITGQRFIVELQPVNEFEFKQRYGISPEYFHKLQVRGIVLPDIYVGDENDWKDDEYDYMTPILDYETTLYHGERITGYFDALLRVKGKGRYEDVFEEAKVVVDSFLPKDINCGLRERNNLMRMHSHRLAYLKAMNKAEGSNISDKVEEILSDRTDKYTLQDKTNFLGVAKHLVASPISAALCKTLVGGHKQSRKRRLLPQKLQRFLLSEDFFDNSHHISTAKINAARNIVSWFLQEQISTFIPVPIFKRPLNQDQEYALLKSMEKHSGLIWVVDKIHEKTMELVASGIVSESEPEKLAKELREELLELSNRIQRLPSWVTNATAATGSFLCTLLFKDFKCTLVTFLLASLGKIGLETLISNRISEQSRAYLLVKFRLARPELINFCDTIQNLQEMVIGKQ